MTLNEAREAMISAAMRDFYARFRGYVMAAEQSGFEQGLAAAIAKPAKKTRTVKAKDRLIPVPQLFRDKPASSKLAYTLKHSQRGRVPAWVLKQAKVRNKPALRAKFKDGHRFVKVQP